MASPRTGRDDDIHNQSPPFVDVNFFTSDLALREAVAREGDASAAGELEAFGKLAGSAGALDLGRLANEHPPRLRSHDPQGRRIDHVEFHPAYHRLMAMAAQQGLHCSPFEHLAQGGEPRKGAHVMRCGGKLRGGADGARAWLPHHDDPRCARRCCRKSRRLRATGCRRSSCAATIRAVRRSRIRRRSPLAWA